MSFKLAVSGTREEDEVVHVFTSLHLTLRIDDYFVLPNQEFHFALADYESGDHSDAASEIASLIAGITIPF